MVRLPEADEDRGPRADARAATRRCRTAAASRPTRTTAARTAALRGSPGSRARPRPTSPWRSSGNATNVATMQPTTPSAVHSVTVQLPNSGHTSAAVVQFTNPYGYAYASPCASTGMRHGSRPWCQRSRAMYQTCTWLLMLSDDSTIACRRYSASTTTHAAPRSSDDDAPAGDVVGRVRRGSPACVRTRVSCAIVCRTGTRARRRAVSSRTGSQVARPAARRGSAAAPRRPPARCAADVPSSPACRSMIDPPCTDAQHLVGDRAADRSCRGR